jgi:hypothetical protein
MKEARSKMVASCMAQFSTLKMEVVSSPPSLGQLLPDWKPSQAVKCLCL